MAQLAQVNIGRIVATLEDPLLAGFVAALEPVNASADAAPGFVWRLTTEDDGTTPTALDAFGWDQQDGVAVLVNMSVWTDVAALSEFIYSERHREVLRQRRRWFAPMREAWTACWWIADGTIPTTQDAEDRLRHLRAYGPTPWAFGLRESFPPPADGQTYAPVSLLPAPRSTEGLAQIC